MSTVVGACPLDCPDACSWVVTLEADADMARGAIFHDNRVWIRPVSD